MCKRCYLHPIPYVSIREVPADGVSENFPKASRGQSKASPPPRSAPVVTINSILATGQRSFDGGRWLGREDRSDVPVERKSRAWILDCKEQKFYSKMRSTERTVLQ